MPAGLRRLVLSLVAIGAAAQAVVAFFTRDTGPVTSLADKLPWAHGVVLLGVMLALTVIGDLVSVRVRHGDESDCGHSSFARAHAWVTQVSPF